MPCVVIHCLEGKNSVEHISAHAKRIGLEVCHVCPSLNQNGIEISCRENSGEKMSVLLEEFIRIYENNPQIALFYDHSDPRNGKIKKYVSHMKRGEPTVPLTPPLGPKVGLEGKKEEKGDEKKYEKKEEKGDEKKYEKKYEKKGRVRETAGFPMNSRTAVAMAKYYNFPPTSISSTGGQTVRPTIAIISLGGSYLQTDMDQYWKHVGFTGAAIPQVTTIRVGGSTATFTGSDEDIENTLDLQIAGGVCPGSNLLFYSAPNTDLGFYQAINSALNGRTIVATDGPNAGKKIIVKPNAISISWGAAELYYSSPALRSFDQLFALAKSNGIVVCAASGDNGSTDGVGDNLLHVDFPGSSPNVISCGGTSLVNPNVETAWSWNGGSRGAGGAAGGGGISTIWKQPLYQVGVVDYTGLPTRLPSSVPLVGNRAVPDIALNGDPASGWSIFFAGSMHVNSIGGTSCVAPAMAGYLASLHLPATITSKIHENLYTIYRNSSTRSCYKSIVIGSNDNVIGTSGVFSAGPGYDFCTGLGSFNGSTLYDALKKINVK